MNWILKMSIKQIQISCYKKLYATEEFFKNIIRTKRQKELVKKEELVFYLIKHHCPKCKTDFGDDNDVCTKCGKKYTFRVRVDAWNEFILEKRVEQERKRETECLKTLSNCKKHGMTPTLQLKENMPPFCTACIAEAMLKPFVKNDH